MNGRAKQGIFERYGLSQVSGLIACFSLLLFCCSAFRHAVFSSTAFDLGIFDQALWQLSRGFSPNVSLLGMNILADHGAFILYPLSLAYHVFPSPYVILAIQSLMLSFGALPVLLLAQHYGLNPRSQIVCVLVYLLHPCVFNANLFDFHPETIGIPFVLLVVLMAERRRFVAALGCAVIVMSCKEVLSLSVAALGVCFALKQHRRFGLGLVVFGVSWFVVVTQVIMPHVPGGAMPNAFLRYSFLGDSLWDKVKTVAGSPWTTLLRAHPFESGSYLIQLVLPCFWVFGRSTAVYLPALIPIVALNALSTLELQRSLRLQYSLPLIPIFSLMAMERLRSLEGMPSWFTLKRAELWSLLCFAAPLLAGNTLLFGRYPVAWAPVGETRSFYSAVEAITPDASVLASSRIVPHVAHRVGLGLIDERRFGNEEDAAKSIEEYQYIIIDLSNFGSGGEQNAQRVLERVVRRSASFSKVLEAQGVAVYRHQ